MRKLRMAGLMLLALLLISMNWAVVLAEATAPPGLKEFDGKLASPWVFQHGKSPLYDSSPDQLKAVLVAMEMSRQIQLGENMDAYVEKMRADDWQFDLYKNIGNSVSADASCFRAYYWLQISTKVHLCLVSNGSLNGEDWKEEWDSYFDALPEDNPIEDMGVKYAFLSISVPISVDGIIVEDELEYPLDLDFYL